MQIVVASIVEDAVLDIAVSLVGIVVESLQFLVGPKKFCVYARMKVKLIILEDILLQGCFLCGHLIRRIGLRG